MEHEPYDSSGELVPLIHSLLGLKLGFLFGLSLNSAPTALIGDLGFPTPHQFHFFYLRLNLFFDLWIPWVSVVSIHIWN